LQKSSEQPLSVGEEQSFSFAQEKKLAVENGSTLQWTGIPSQIKASRKHIMARSTRISFSYQINRFLQSSDASVIPDFGTQFSKTVPEKVDSAKFSKINPSPFPLPFSKLHP
jgi:hypothetical protein